MNPKLFDVDDILGPNRGFEASDPFLPLGGMHGSASFYRLASFGDTHASHNSERSDLLIICVQQRLCHLQGGKLLAAFESISSAGSPS
jgi:hypothetical protein